MIQQLNALRTLAAVCIVMIHVTSGQLLVNDAAYWANQFSRFASPMFILIAGMVLVYIEMNRPSPSLAYFYKRRFSRVLIPYLVWSLVYFLYKSRHLVLDFQWKALGEQLLHVFPTELLRGSAFVHLYFILIMVQLYALFPLLYRWLSVHAGSFVTVCLLLTAGMNGLVYAHQLGWLVLPSIPVPYVVLFVNWIAYFAVGMTVMKHEKRWQQAVLKIPVLILMLCVWIASYAVVMWDGKATGTYAISVKPSSMLYGLVSFMLMYIVIYMVRLPDTKWKKGAVATIEWCAKSSFLLYLIHPLCLNVLVKLSVRYQAASIFYGELGLLLLFGLTLLSSFIGIFLIQLTPFARMLGGARPFKRRAASTASVSKGVNG